MDLNQFDYDLPTQLIAQSPPANRRDSQLLSVGEGGEYSVAGFGSLKGLLRPGDLLVGNDTRVIPARLFAQKPTGGRVEILLERLLNTHSALVQLKANKSVKQGQVLLVGGCEVKVVGRQDRFFILDFADKTGSGDVDMEALFKCAGVMPLPPYIDRDAVAADDTRYQTVFAAQLGAVAAPTAGLHFDAALIEQLIADGIGWDTLTLHVGAGTFLPVQVENVDDHQMHSERVVVSAALCARIASVKAAGGRVIAIGTTVVRSLETAALKGGLGGRLQPYSGETQLFIKPGFPFQVVDGLITNFHLPKSTLLMLVSAFASYDRVMALYRYAIAQQLRFFSYGDAMFLERAE